MSREAIYGALFALVQPLLAPDAVAGLIGNSGQGLAQPGTPTYDRPFNVISRETIEVQRVPPALQPVLFMDEAVEEYVDRGNGLLKHVWTVYFHVGVTSTPGTPAATLLNPILDRLEAALTGDGDQDLGLGDLIETAKLKGLSVKNLGNNSTDPSARQAVCYVPFEITPVI